MTSLLLTLATIYLLDKVANIIINWANSIRSELQRQRHNRLLIGNHPEMKGVRIDNNAGLVIFSSSNEFKRSILDNNEPGDNTAIEDSDRYDIAVLDDDEDDEE